ncbi:Nn.00g073030.m01.CDS01 [Neocucurbitaria sp. VM-36]
MFRSRATRGDNAADHGAPAAHVNNTTDYGAPVSRSNRMHRPLLLAIHLLHWISSIIVMSIAAYFISKYKSRRNTHLIYWVSIAAIDAILYLPAMVLPVMKSYKGYLAPLAWIFSYLWLTAFIFATQDYSGGRCPYNSPTFVTECSIKKTLAAFAFIAFFTNLVGTLLEGRLWDVQRFKGGTTHTGAFDNDKHHHHARPVAAGEPTATTATATPHTTTV